MKYLYIILLLLSCCAAQAQNLVPNPSFEEFIYCPTHIDSISACAYWHSGWQPTTTPNYFNSCSSNPDISPPNVVWGYQVPHSGNAYCYIATYHPYIPLNRRETIQTTLIQPLIKGQRYFVSFYASFPGIGANGTMTDKLGALVTTYPFTKSNYATPKNYAQVYSSTIITDTLNWVQVKGAFVADSAYKYISLGNFFDDAHTDTVIFQGISPIGGGYYIDDICVSEDSVLCYISSTVKDLNFYSTQKVYPNPANEVLNITLRPTANNIEVYNLLGELIIQEDKHYTPLLSINCSLWKEGIYIVKINNSFYKVLITH